MALLWERIQKLLLARIAVRAGIWTRTPFRLLTQLIARHVEEVLVVVGPLLARVVEVESIQLENLARTMVASLVQGPVVLLASIKSSAQTASIAPHAMATIDLFQLIQRDASTTTHEGDELDEEEGGCYVDHLQQ